MFIALIVILLLLPLVARQRFERLTPPFAFGVMAALLPVARLHTVRREAELRGPGGEAAVLALDIATEDAPARIVEAATSEFGGVDILVNNANVAFPVPLEDSGDDFFRQCFEAGPRAGLALMRAVRPVMAERGGGVIINNQLLRGTNGFAAEIGHIPLVPHGRPCGCGRFGCWEAYSSGNALVREARDVATDSPAVAARLLELGGGEPQGITGLMVTQAAQEGDATAIECFNTLGRWMGAGLADLAAVLDPEIFVLAGGVCEAGDLLLEPTRRSFERCLTAGSFRPAIPIAIATLGNEAGIIGAADLARQ